MRLDEGWNQTLGSLARASFLHNSDADLVLRAWSIVHHGQQQHAHGANVGRTNGDELRAAGDSGEVAVKGWPAEACSVVAPLENGGAVVLHFEKGGGHVNATLFEDGGAEESERESSCSSTPGRVLVHRLTGDEGSEMFESQEESANSPPR